MKQRLPILILFLSLILIIINCEKDRNNPLDPKADNYNAVNYDTARTLKVTINYSGTGTVDSSHKLFLRVTSDAAFQNEIASSELASSPATIIYANMPGTVYVAAFYDVDGSHDPTSGDRAEMYNNKAISATGTPVSIAEGETNHITMDVNNDFIVDGAVKVTVTYTGSSNTSIYPICAAVFSNTNFGPGPITEQCSTTPTGTVTFILTGISNINPVYLLYYLDADQSGNGSPGDSVEIYNDKFLWNQSDPISISPHTTSDVGLVDFDDSVRIP